MFLFRLKLNGLLSRWSPTWLGPAQPVDGLSANPIFSQSAYCLHQVFTKNKASKPKTDTRSSKTEAKKDQIPKTILFLTFLLLHITHSQGFLEQTKIDYFRLVGKFRYIKVYLFLVKNRLRPIEKQIDNNTYSRCGCRLVLQ